MQKVTFHVMENQRVTESGATTGTHRLGKPSLHNGFKYPTGFSKGGTDALGFRIDVRVLAA